MMIFVYFYFCFKILFINSNFVILIIINYLIYIYINFIDFNNANISIFPYHFNLISFVLFEFILKIKLKN